MQVLEATRFEDSCAGRRRKRVPASQMRLWQRIARADAMRSFWQRRFYDFNVWSTQKEEREVALHAFQSRETKTGGRSEAVALEQLPLLPATARRASARRTLRRGKELEVM